jgi:antirestriction protein ArdC
MKQTNQLGGSVRRGEHSQIVVFWKIDQIPNGGDDGCAEEYEADEKSRRRFFPARISPRRKTWAV